MQTPDLNVETLTRQWTTAQPVVASFILSLEPRMQQAEDILQEVALTIVRNYHRYDPDRSFVAWALGIAGNQVRMYHRQTAKDRHVFHDGLIEQVASSYEKKGDRMMETKHALIHCVDKLQPKWKKMLTLRYSMGLEVKGVAKQMDISSNAAFIALHRIRIALRKCILNRLSVEET